MTEQVTYSTYLMPDEKDPVFQRLVARVKSLSSEFGAPDFVPHITLLSGIASKENALAGAQKAASQIKPSEVTLSMMDYTDGLYQTLVVRVVMDKWLRDANKAARDVFHRHGDSLFVPHISLLYKTGIANEKKLQLISGIEPEFFGKVLHLDRIQVFTSRDEIEKWENVGEFLLAA